MKRVKSLVFSAVLLSMLAVNTLAGDQETPGFAPPPPPNCMATNTSNENTSAQLSVSCTQVGDTTAETADNLLYEALAALLSVF
jgi:hypothetical protein